MNQPQLQLLINEIIKIVKFDNDDEDDKNNLNDDENISYLRRHYIN